MTLVKFYDVNNDVMYINPETVTALRVSSSQDRKHFTAIYTTDGNNPYFVKGDIQAIYEDLICSLRRI